MSIRKKYICRGRDRLEWRRDRSEPGKKIEQRGWWGICRLNRGRNRSDVGICICVDQEEIDAGEEIDMRGGEIDKSRGKDRTEGRGICRLNMDKNRSDVDI